MLFATRAGIYLVLKTCYKSLTVVSQYHSGIGHYITIQYGQLHLPIICGKMLADLVEMEH